MNKSFIPKIKRTIIDLEQRLRRKPLSEEVVAELDLPEFYILDIKKLFFDKLYGKTIKIQK